MYVLDNFIRDKFLEDITNFLEKYKIKDNTFLLEGLVVHLTFRTNSLEIRQDFRNIYSNLYQRYFTQLEVLSTKQQLEPSRQVFRLLKDYIATKTISIGWPQILSLFISYKNKELIQHLYPIKLFPLTDDHPQSPRRYPPLFIIYRAPEPPSDDSEEELDPEIESDPEMETDSDIQEDSENNT